MKNGAEESKGWFVFIFEYFGFSLSNSRLVVSFLGMMPLKI